MPCYRPVQINKAGYADLRQTVACGRCIGCRIDRSAEWAARLTHENKLHEESCFLTLTYSDENIPSTGSLNKRDFQLFMKRLRKVCPNRIRFFHCGEYGDDKGRPHYHAIIYGYRPDDLKHRRNGAKGHPLYSSEKLDALWGHGHVWVGEVTPQSCGYVARYVMKKINGQQAERHYEKIDPFTGEIVKLLPEYVTMSTKPGIGRLHYEKFKADIYPADEVIIAGKQRRVPKYYDRLLRKEDPDLYASLKVRRVNRARSQSKDNTPSRLRVREEVRLAKLSQLKRELK